MDVGQRQRCSPCRMQLQVRTPEVISALRYATVTPKWVTAAQKSCAQHQCAARWHNYVKNGPRCLLCGPVSFKYCSEVDAKDASKSFLEIHRQPFFPSLSLPLKSSLPHPSPLKPKAQEIFLVEQFGLELCQSVTWLIPQPFFIVGDSLYCTITAAQHPVAWTGSPVMLNTGPQWTTWHTSSFEINVNVVCSQSTNRFLSFKFFLRMLDSRAIFHLSF